MPPSPILRVEHKDLNRRLEALPNPLRVAVGAAAVERVLPLFEAMSDVGSESLRGALAVAWRYARGETVDLAELARIFEQMRWPGPDEEDIEAQGSLARIVRTVAAAVSNLCRAVDPREKIPVFVISGAIDQAREAVFLFERYEDATNDWALCEDEWQVALLALAEASHDPGALHRVGPPPPWRSRLEEEWGWEGGF